MEHRTYELARAPGNLASVRVILLPSPLVQNLLRMHAVTPLVLDRKVREAGCLLPEAWLETGVTPATEPVNRSFRLAPLA